VRVAVSVGHHPGAPGFSAGQYSEYSEMAVVVGFVVQTLMYQGVMAYLVGAGSLRQKVAAINALDPDVALELHLNAGGGDGTEVLYAPGSATGRRLAEIVNRAIIQLTGERDRGIKEGWYQGGDAPGSRPDYFLAATHCPAIITEGYFLDQLPDRQAYAGKADYYQKLAFAVAGGIINYRDKVML
jgi:N-acetylmuramoyl-L-alanine amidase